MKKTSFRKKNFILLEVLIAFFLVVIIAFPFVKNPYAILKKQLKNLESIECDTLAEESFAEILTLLYEKKIDWEDLIHSDKNNAFKLPAKTIQIKGFKDREIERKYSFKATSPKKGRQSNIYYKLTIKLTLSSRKNKKKYRYLTIVENDVLPSDDFI